MTRPDTFDHLRTSKKPNVKRALIPLDSDIADSYEEAKEKFEKAERMLEIRPDDPKAQYDFDMTRDAMEIARNVLLDSSVEFVFRSIGRRKYEDLVMEHPPTPDQQETAKKAGDGNYLWNPDTFPQAIIAASVVSPTMEEADVKEIWESPDWNSPELLSLLNAALEANSSMRIVDIPKG